MIIDPRNLIPLTFASEAASRSRKTHLLLPLYSACDGVAVTLA